MVALSDVTPELLDRQWLRTQVRSLSIRLQRLHDEFGDCAWALTRIKEAL